MPTQPVLIRNHLQAYDEPKELLLVHEGRVHTMSPALVNVIGRFHDDGHGGLIAAAKAANGRFGYINAAGAWLVAPELDDARNFGADDSLARYCEQGKWGYLNLAAQAAIAPAFAKAEAFHHGLAAVQAPNGKWRYIDTTGQFAFAQEFVFAHAFSAIGLAPACASRAKKTGYIDRQGNWAIAPQFERALQFCGEGVAPASLDSALCGLIDTTGHWILKPAYSGIGEFNADGLAYCDEPTPGEINSGYLDTRGKQVIKHQNWLSRQMVGGIVKQGDYTYLTPGGQLPNPDGVGWGTSFNQYGFAIGRVSGFRHPEPATWGIVRTDGAFLPAPAGVLEPLVTSSGAVSGTESNTPLATFVSEDNAFVLLDRDARITYRLQREQCEAGYFAALYDHQQRLLWQGPPSELLPVAWPFFSDTADSFLDQMEAREELIDVADALLAETERKLHRLASEPELDIDDESGEDEEDDDEDEDGDSDIASYACTRRRVFRSYIDEIMNGRYEFMAEDREALRSEMHADLLARLRERFGAGDPDPDYGGIEADSGTLAWSVSLQVPLPACDDDAADQRRLWLGIGTLTDSGDGDEWREIWLTCAPSRETLEAAMEARAQLPGQEDEDEDDDEDDDEDAGDLLAMATSSEYGISRIADDAVTDELADAAIDAFPNALQLLPARFQTPARLERLIRKGCAAAMEVSAVCMSTAGLALARALYGEDDDWIAHDKRRSQRRREWDSDCLYGYWGALVDPTTCVRALNAGAALHKIPLWLRTPAIEDLALKLNISNISTVGQDRITRAHAERAVRVNMLKDIPSRLVTPALCLLSVQHGGRTLEFVPPALRSVELCAAALESDSAALHWVPDDLCEEVCTWLIDADLAARATARKPVSGSRWHGVRAWVRMYADDYSGAIADATVASAHAPHSAHPRYILAFSLDETGRTMEAALEAATVLAINDEYEPEFDYSADISWLARLCKKTLGAADDAALLQGMQSHPLALARVPQKRITQADIETALAANSKAFAFVPKKLKTPELYVFAMRELKLPMSDVPRALRTEPVCLAGVAIDGHNLEFVPVEMRSLELCVSAVRQAGTTALRFVPQPLIEPVYDIVSDQP